MESLTGMKYTRPQLVNYVRVVIDVILVILLLFVVVANVKESSDDPRMVLQLYQVPVYLKRPVDYHTMFADATEVTTLDDAAKLLKFQVPAAAACVGAELHPMCTCISNASYLLDAKNCLLQNPIPSQLSNWNVGSVSSALVLWFTASLATSVGTLPFITTYVSSGGVKTENTVVTWHRVVVVLYVLLTISALVLPFCVLGYEFGNSTPHMEAMGNILMWSLLAIASLSLYNHRTIVGYLSWTILDGENKGKTASGHLTMAVHNFILYVHLLVAAPAIAMILHINQGWTEYHTIVNTTLVLSTIFAVDAFSAEMANFWNSKASRDEEIELKTLSDQQSAGSEIPTETLQQREDRKKKASDLNMRLGLVRLFAWIVNATMLLLLFTIAYPLAIDHQRISSALFVVIVVMITAVFLAPDLVREFTQRISFNNIQFRLYGDFALRCLVLFFTWRGSVMIRV